MRQFDYSEKWQRLLTPEIVSYLTQIHEFKGEQTLFIEAKADILTQLVEIAKIQSTEASNKIEGIYTSDERLRALVKDTTRPKTRNEREIAGYRDVLNSIHESHDYIPPKPSIILQLHTTYVETAGINEFEEIREKLRDLMKYIQKENNKYVTNFADELLLTEWKEAELETDTLKNYKAKAEYYIMQHQDNAAIAKLKTNQPLTSEDISMLEEILWKEIGTKQDYEDEYGTKPLGEFVREIVGLDMNAAKEAFAPYTAGLNSRQIYFVNQIIEYIVRNGMMKDLSVLQESPFTDRGSITEIFTDLTVWMGVKKAIDTINANAAA